MPQIQYKAGEQMVSTTGATATAPTAEQVAANPSLDWFSEDWSPAPVPASPAPASAGIVDSTTNQREGETAIKYDANEMLTNISDYDKMYNDQLNALLGATPYNQTPEGQQAQGGLTTALQNLGVFSSAEEQQIAEAGQGVQAEFAPLIAEAEASKKQGMPKAIIGAGERGGFMSTQFAGGAALQTTEEGTFLGEGGELRRIQSVYDANIQAIKAKAAAAALAAKAAARQAIKTGKKEDYQFARQAFMDVQDMSNQAIQLANDRVDLIAKAADRQREMLKENKDVGDTLKKDAAEKVDYYLKNYGYEYLQNNQATIAKLFKDAGYEDADTATMLKVMKEEYDKANQKDLPKPELRSVGSDLYALTYNEKTGEYEEKLVIAGKKTETGGGNASDEGDRNKIQADIEAIKGSDKYLDTEKYAQIRQNVAVNSPKLLTWFDSTYKPAMVLNPNDPTAKKYFVAPENLSD